MADERWLEVRKSLEAHKARRRGEVLKEGLTELDSFGNEIAIEREDAVTITEFGTVVDPSEVPGALKGYANRAKAGQWATVLSRSQTHHAEQRYAGDSKTSDAKAGDIKAPPHDETHFVLRGAFVHDGARLAWFRLTYVSKPANVKGVPTIKPSAVDAMIWDAITGDKVLLKQVTAFDDWFTVFTPKPEGTAPRKKRLTKEEKLLAGGEFSG